MKTFTFQTRTDANEFLKSKGFKENELARRLLVQRNKIGEFYHIAVSVNDTEFEFDTVEVVYQENN